MIERLHRTLGHWNGLPVAALILAAGFVSADVAPSRAQGIEIRGPIEDVPTLKDREGTAQTDPNFNTTVVPRSDPSAEDETPEGDFGTLTLEATLTSDGQAIDNGLTWRVFQQGIGINAQPRLVQTAQEPTPTLRLPQGTYFVNAAYGQANLTRRIVVLANGRLLERFVLNAGGLRAEVGISAGLPPPIQSVRIRIYSDESDQAGRRKLIANNVKPGVVVRLNAGIYHLESRIGRANAVVKSQVSVEAGKLTRAKITHEAALITFKLVAQAGGEAIAGTEWTVLAENGDVVRESVGALPRHMLAPGGYTVSAVLDGRSYRRRFRVLSGQNSDVEVLRR